MSVCVSGCVCVCVWVVRCVCDGCVCVGGEVCVCSSQTVIHSQQN